MRTIPVMQAVQQGLVAYPHWRMTDNRYDVRCDTCGYASDPIENRGLAFDVAMQHNLKSHGIEFPDMSAEQEDARYLSRRRRRNRR